MELIHSRYKFPESPQALWDSTQVSDKYLRGLYRSLRRGQRLERTRYYGEFGVLFGSILLPHVVLPLKIGIGVALGLSALDRGQEVIRSESLKRDKKMEIVEDAMYFRRKGEHLPKKGSEDAVRMNRRRMVREVVGNF